MIIRKISTNKLFRSLYFIGDKESGKTTLLAKLQGNEDPKKGSGLDFNYIHVTDDECEEHTLLGLAVLDGDPAHSNLLRFALNEENFADTTVMICSSMSTPWAIMDQLTMWISVLQDHIDSLSLTADQVKSFRQSRMTAWENYLEPGLDFNTGFSRQFSGSESRTLDSPLQEQFPMTDLSPMEEHKSIASYEEILSRNLGLDIMIVLTKTDSMPQLESEYGLTDQHFDFIQQAVRRFCLTYGASLFFTSVKEDKNCDLLYKYLTHKTYNFPFTTPALVVERDAVFIPAGWDSPGKVSILLENLFKFRPEQNYKDVIKSPFVGKKPIYQKNVEIVAENEQDFLARIAPFLVQDSHQDSPLSSRLLHSSESVLKTPERKSVGSPGVHSTLRKTEYGSGKAINDGAISNFFHALLNKKTGAGTSPGITSPAKFAEDVTDKQQMILNPGNSDNCVPVQTQLKQDLINTKEMEKGQTETKS